MKNLESEVRFYSRVHPALFSKAKNSKLCDENKIEYKTGLEKIHKSALALKPLKQKMAYLLIVLLMSVVSFAQQEKTFSIKGEVLGDKNEKVQEGELQLYKGDSIVKVALIKDGSFQFESLKSGSYTITVLTDKYAENIYPLDLTEDTSITIVLSTMSKKLEEVTVTSNRRVFVNKNGNTLVNVENSMLSKMPDALDILSKLPGLQLSADKETLSMIGKGSPLIYVGNQNVDLDYLKTISVDDIKSMEIINNPSSKYEASGRAVILITLKLSRKEGYHVEVTDTYQKKRQHNNYLGLNSSFKKKKFEFKANFNYNALNPWERNGNEMTILDKSIYTSYSVTSLTIRPQFTSGIGAYYNINENDYISIGVNGILQNDSDKNTTNTYHKTDSLAENILTLNRNEESRNSLNTFLNYNKKFKKLGNVFLGAQYVKFDQNGNSVISNQYNLQDLSLSQNRKQHFTIDVYSGRLDYEKALNEKMKFELGGLAKSATAKTHFNFFNYELNQGETSDYLYRENNYAAYTQLSGEIRKVGYLLGIRAENTDVNGGYVGSGTLLIDKNYTNWFPKAKLDIPVDSGKTLSLSYSKSILRPNYSSTSQVSVYINPYLVFSRNLNLNPTLIEELSASFQFKSKSITAHFYQTRSPVYYSFEQNTAQNLLIFKPINYKKESGVNVNLSIPVEYKKWSSANMISVVYNKIEDPSAKLASTKPYLYFYSNHTFRLPKDFMFNVGVWGLTSRNEGVFERNGLVSVDFSINRKLFKKIDCTVGMNDAFRNANYTEDFMINNIASAGHYYTDTQAIYCTLKYEFGVIKNSSYKRKNVDEDQGRNR